MAPARLVGVALLCAFVSACAPHASAPRQDVPVLRLSPASLGRTMAVQQQLQVTVRGRSRQVEVVLEADPDAVRLAMLELGQAVARLEWDGASLRETRAPGWPETVRGDRVLGDLQLIYWPVEAVRAALPPGWALEVDGGDRVLALRGQKVIEVRYLAGGVVELTNRVVEYRLRVESKGLGP